MIKILYHLKKLAGQRHQIRRASSLVLITLFISVILMRNIANIGGNIAFASPKDVIDATTVASVRLPMNYDYESRGFSWFHAGADLVAKTGTSVYPVMTGTVKAINYDYFGYGVHVIVEHFDGYESLYGHLSKITVKPGQKVDLNTELGKSGSTGFSTGPHLHLEIRQNGQLVNPADIVPGVK